MLAATIGAVVGGVAGYLIFTEGGRGLRQRVVPALEEFADELLSVKTSALKLTDAASETWKVVDDLFGDRSKAAEPHGRSLHAGVS
jgi:gas vesicle protein